MVKYGVRRYPVPKYPVEIKYEVPLVPVTNIGRRNIPNEYLGNWGKGSISHRTLAQLGPIRSGPVLSGIVRYGMVWYGIMKIRASVASLTFIFPHPPEDN